MNKLTRHLWNSVYFAADAGTGTDPGAGGGKPPAGGDSKATNLPNGNGSGGDGGGDLGEAWKGLEFKNPDNLKAIQDKKWSSPEDVITSYRELESSKSKEAGLKVPGKDAKPEDWDAFYKAVGRPEKPEAYEFKIAEDVPENFPYDEQAATGFKDIAHKTGLLPHQAQALHDWFVNSLTGPWTQSIKDTVGKIEGAHDAIVSEWGDPKGEVYKRNVELADRTIRELSALSSKGKDKQALRKELVEIGALAPDGKVMAPRLVLALAKIGETLYNEDKVYGGDVAAGGKNPWKTETENLTEQGRLIKQEPEIAKQLILAANLDPKRYGL